MAEQVLSQFRADEALIEATSPEDTITRTEAKKGVFIAYVSCQNK